MGKNALDDFEDSMNFDDMDDVDVSFGNNPDDIEFDDLDGTQDLTPFDEDDYVDDFEETSDNDPFLDDYDDDSSIYIDDVFKEEEDEDEPYDDVEAEDRYNLRSNRRSDYDDYE